ncbi:MBL fold metallo-hydrolase [Neorhizobium galegae]|uniref:MBL fold metallo-hydrolase n=1 Tax=Neorhizobium galegae TaxID=399 RepID=UPI000622A76B|nr:MBL fold metallo-hydrolase [Neorhizobium galegae]CDZ60276.1 Beta-lactamase class B [Neorhizobium galegae bv. orientalis]KAB1120956.1 MBL fold metallo-hydrolase [Neorhizobium galegae]MCQ1574513.1 MBL fold metallo-hydrolase [Neorhizobium galegae]MCQ1810314.1 MBL fold metallo-hydrolase [Neorhizobium galegae]MCQ1838886.1 MBL fold metallo-hydrolase [Neorhizobium galegae]
MKSTRVIVNRRRSFALAAGICSLLFGPAPLNASEGSSVADNFRKAFEAAGTQHFNLYNMLCPRIENANAGKIGQPKEARKESIEKAVSAKVFDNLYYVGEYAFWESSASSWAVDTGEGVVLIDTLNPDSGPILVEKGLREQGLDPQNIKYIIVGHAHGDHYGGARYLQDKYGARIMMSDAEWDFLAKDKRDPAQKPKKDMVIKDGETFRLGSASFTFYVTPGHTPGTVSTIFTVKDGPKERKVAQWGGTGFGFGGAEGEEKLNWFKTYVQSAERFKNVIKESGADVLIANHPGLDNTPEKNAALSQPAGRDSNPWVIGNDRVVAYVQTAQSCAAAGLAAYQ